MQVIGILVFALIMANMIFLVVMSLYQLFLVISYRKKRGADPVPAVRFDPENLPRVTVQLPVYNEGPLARQILERASALDYPHDRLQIQYLDDSDDETTTEIALQAIDELRAKHPDIDIQYLRRDNRKGFKAGALLFGTKQASGEFLAIFDADFLIPEDYLRHTIDHFTDPSVGAVQARWDYVNCDDSIFARLQANKLDAHQMFEQTARARLGFVPIFHGTAGVWRAEALAAAGGWDVLSEVEDVEITIKAAAKGWKVVYLDHYRIHSELPENVSAFLRQQMRWRRGWTRVVLHYSNFIRKSDLPRSVRLDLLMRIHLTWGPVAATIATLGVLPCFMLAQQYGLTIWAIIPYVSSLVIALFIRFYESRTLDEDPLSRPPIKGAAFLQFIPLSYVMFSLGMLWPLAQATLEGFGKGQIWEVTPKSGTTAGSSGHFEKSRSKPPMYVFGTLFLAFVGAACSLLAIVMFNPLAAIFYGLLSFGSAVIGLMLLQFYGYQSKVSRWLVQTICE